MEGIARGFGALVVAVALAGGAGTAWADSPSCREWRGEHLEWKAEVVHRYLGGAPQRAVDEAVFEMLQREAYLTACEIPVEMARWEMVGWRLSGRAPDEFGTAVLESVLDQAGFDVGLRAMFAKELPAATAARDAHDDAHF
jgi:hypothetical protein